MQVYQYFTILQATHSKKTHKFLKNKFRPQIAYGLPKYFCNVKIIKQGLAFTTKTITTMAKKFSDKNTKAEILDAYAQLVAELEVLAKDKKTMEVEMSKLAKQLSQVQANGNGQTHTKIVVAPPVKQEKFSVEEIIDVFENVKTGFGGASSELSGKLTKEAYRLAEIHQEITEIEKHIGELHSINAIQEDTCTQLVEDYLEKSKSFVKEAKDKEENAKKLLAEKQKTWSKEQNDKDFQIRERNNSLVKERKRENDEYLYQLEQQRKLAQDQFEQQKKKLYHDLEDLKKAKEKEWAEKEKAVAELEKLYTETKQKADELPEKLEKELKQVREMTKGAVRREAEIKANLLAKEIEGQKRLNDLKIKSLEETVAKQNEQTTLLRTQLTEALKQAKELAMKAIEGGASSKSFDAIREIALEQAKQQKNK